MYQLYIKLYVINLDFLFHVTDEYEGISRSVTNSRNSRGNVLDRLVVVQGPNLSALSMMSGPDSVITIGSLGSPTFSRTPGSALMTDDQETRPEDPTDEQELPAYLIYYSFPRALLVYAFFWPQSSVFRPLLPYRCLSSLINEPKINSKMRHGRGCLGERLSHISKRG